METNNTGVGLDIFTVISIELAGFPSSIYNHT